MPENQHMDIADHVLGKLSAAEIKVLTQTVEDAGKAVELIISGGVQSAMNKLN